MSMLHTIISLYDKLSPVDSASAHCDIPCKIYDPITAQISVLTIIRLVDLLNELPSEEKLTVNQQAQFIRLTAEKEEHGKQLKEEIRVIWGDYIKQPQLDKFPNIHELVHSIMLQTSKVKQHIDRDASVELLKQVNEFADIFWKTKGVDTFTATCPYPPSLEVVYPRLK